MKLKNFTMISEDKVTEIFCIADDLCIVFDARMAKYTFRTERKRKYHRESRMSKAGIMVIFLTSGVCRIIYIILSPPTAHYQQAT